MKIAQIVCVFPPYKGGIGTMAYNHSVSLSRAGHEVTVFTPNYDSKKDITELFEGFTVKRLNPFFKFGNGAVLNKILNELDNFDVVHLHYPFFGTAEIIWLMNKIKKRKYKLVITYHMDIVGGNFLRPFFYLHTKFIMPSVVKNADKIIVTSNDYAAHSNIKKLFYTIPDKFIDIPPEVDTNFFTKQNEINELLNKYNIDKQKEKIILFVGGLDQAHYFKGIEFLISSFKVLKKSSSHVIVKLVIVGDGELRKDYEKKVMENDLKFDIIFAGNVDNKELPKYYSMADVTILPSINKSEAFGIVLIESLACETPVIASNLPGVRTVINNGTDGYLIRVKNEGDLAHKVNELLSNREKKLFFGKVGREKVIKNFDTKVILEKLINVYKH